MAKRLYNTPFLSLLPGSISGDATIKAAAASLDGVLRSLTLSVPNLLIYSRLLLTAGRKATTSLLPALQRIVTARGGLKPLSTPELELLAWQFHVDFREVAKTDAQLAEMIVQSIAWHRIKGTPASIKRALALFGYGVYPPPGTAAFPCTAMPAIASAPQDAGSSVIIEEGSSAHWAIYQLGLETQHHEDVLHAYTIAKEMQPVRCRLGRVYNQWNDGRIIIHDTQSTWGKYYWEHESGVPVVMPDGETVIVSLGKNVKARVDMPVPLAALGAEHSHVGHVMPRNHWIWNVSRWGDVFPQEARIFCTGQHAALRSAAPETPWNIRRRSDWFEQIVWDDAHSVWGDANFRWGVGCFPWHAAPIWGQFVWGEALPSGVVHTGRRISRSTQLASAPVIAALHPLGVSQQVGLPAAHHPENTWTGEWNQRPWNVTDCFIPHSQTPELPVFVYGHGAAGWGNTRWS